MRVKVNLLEQHLKSYTEEPFNPNAKSIIGNCV